MNLPRLLITGATGLLGRELSLVLADSYNVVPVSSVDADIADARAVESLFESRRPDVIVHTAAFSDVDGCERDPERAQTVNVTGTRTIADWCRKNECRLVFISTDYVFDGAKPEPYHEADMPNPVNVYGRTKLAGEEIVADLGTLSLIVRTGWLYGRYGRDFITAIVSAIASGGPLKVVNDQRGNPTYANNLAQQIKVLVDKGQGGVFHCTSEGSTTWYDYAVTINEQLKLGAVINACSTKAWNAPATRPAHSALENQRLKDSGLNVMPYYLDALCQYLTQYRSELLSEL